MNSHADAKADEKENIQADASTEQHGCFDRFGIKYIFKGEKKTALCGADSAGSRHSGGRDCKDRLAGYQFAGREGCVPKGAVNAVGYGGKGKHLQE